ncbi:alpha/beta hydrolase [Thalassospira marina]|uniref:Alpha/beta hydrolase n=2 Tax=Thalassospira marina TaxID=2048283 RepID=A0A2N3KQX2_9PROT|nr:alpha/beta hydrolase [Thalassospira marina]
MMAIHPRQCHHPIAHRRNIPMPVPTQPALAQPALAQHPLDLPDARLIWTHEGNETGPTLIWAHGLMSDSYSLEQNGIYDFAPISAAGRLVRYDARGHGRSTANPFPERFSWPCLADDLLALARAASPNKPVIGMGCSMGTATLLHAVLKAPDAFSKLVLTAAPTAWETRQAQASVYENAATTIEKLGQPALDALVANMAPPPIFTDLPAFPVEITLEMLPAILRGAGMSDFPARKDLTSITQPTLILAWESDPSHPVATAQTLASLLPNAELHIAKSIGEVNNWGQRIAQFMSE